MLNIITGALLLVASTAQAAPAALPRFATASERFELVGVVDGRQLTLFVDRFADNTPVRGAKVDLDIGGAQVTLKERAEGEFAGTLAADLPSGTTPVAATIAAGADTDRLATEIDVHGEPHDAEPHDHDLRGPAAAVAVAVAAAAAAAWFIRRRRTGGAA